MRTKALLLAAAFAAAGVATSVAQVYSVNAVGYVNTTLKPGFNMVANPLDAGPTGNQLGNLFKNIQGAIPAGYKVFLYDPAIANYKVLEWDDFDLVFTPADVAARVLDPGNGVFVFNPTASTDLTLTFVGEVKQGTLNNALPRGFSIKANVVPQAGKPDAFGLPGTTGDKIFRYVPAIRNYNVFEFDDFDNVWNPVLPSMNVGEAWFMYRGSSSGTWTRSFNVNNPTG
jgi:hypothetical protein